MKAETLKCLAVAQPVAVPGHIVRCPECDSELICQLTTPDLQDLDVECEFEASCVDEQDANHRHWQGEWEPVIQRVGEWVRQNFEMPQ